MKKPFKINIGLLIVLAIGSFISFILYVFFNAKASEMLFDDYYKEETTYQQKIDAKKNVLGLSEPMSISIDKQGVLIDFPKLFNKENAKGEIQLFRLSNRSLDKKMRLVFNRTNGTLIPSGFFKKGLYRLSIHWSTENKDYLFEKEIEWKW